MLETTLIYGITFAISLIFCRIYEKTNEKNSIIKNIFLIVGILLPPIALATLRYNVGTDYQAYIINYININWPSFKISLLWEHYTNEPLYVVINYLGYLLCRTPYATGMYFIASCIYMFFIFEGISYFKKKNSMTLSLFIFYMTYYLVFFNAMRQMLAAVIILFAFRYILEKKPVKYILWVIIAGMFHKTAYLMMFLYLLNFKVDSRKVNKIFYILLLLISPIFMLPIQKIIVYLTNKFMIYENYANMATSLDLNFLLYVVPILFLVTLKRKKILKLDKKYETLIRILFLQLPFQILGCFINIADRMAIYCAVFQVILIPIILRTDMNIEENKINSLEDCKFLERISDKNKRLIMQNKINLLKIINSGKVLESVIISWYVLYFIVMYAVLGGQGVYPYQSVFGILK